jgi:hypothetical protein
MSAACSERIGRSASVTVFLLCGRHFATASRPSVKGQATLQAEETTLPFWAPSLTPASALASVNRHKIQCFTYYSPAANWGGNLLTSEAFRYLKVDEPPQWVGIGRIKVDGVIGVL